MHTHTQTLSRTSVPPTHGHQSGNTEQFPLLRAAGATAPAVKMHAVDQLSYAVRVGVSKKIRPRNWL